jgi:L-ascorbate metabolism protein UlaG (beta-lactamase superfamily)
MKLTWVGGATTLLQESGLKIAVDPVLCPKGSRQDYGFFASERLDDPVWDAAAFADIDLLLLTHYHLDHLDEAGAAAVKPRILIAPAGAVPGGPADRLRADGRIALRPNTSYRETIKGVDVKVTSLPAVHGKNRLVASLVGPGCGYLVELDSGRAKRAVYITGDDVFRRRPAALKDRRPDLVVAYGGRAVVAAGPFPWLLGRITNSAADLRRLADALQPGLLVPVHWGAFSHYRDRDYRDRRFSRLLGAPPVRLLEPGGSVEF